MRCGSGWSLLDNLDSVVMTQSALSHENHFAGARFLVADQLAEVDPSGNLIATPIASVPCYPVNAPSQLLVDQLADGGRLVIPVGPDGGAQELVRLTRTGERIERENLLPVRFVPLLPGSGLPRR